MRHHAVARQQLLDQHDQRGHRLVLGIVPVEVAQDAGEERTHQRAAVIGAVDHVEILVGERQDPRRVHALGRVVLHHPLQRRRRHAVAQPVHQVVVAIAGGEAGIDLVDDVHDLLVVHVVIGADILVVHQQAAGLEHPVHQLEHLLDAVEMMDRGRHEHGVEARIRKIVGQHVGGAHLDPVRQAGFRETRARTLAGLRRHLIGDHVLRVIVADDVLLVPRHARAQRQHARRWRREKCAADAVDVVAVLRSRLRHRDGALVEKFVLGVVDGIAFDHALRADMFVAFVALVPDRRCVCRFVRHRLFSRTISGQDSRPTARARVGRPRAAPRESCGRRASRRRRQTDAGLHGSRRGRVVATTLHATATAACGGREQRRPPDEELGSPRSGARGGPCCQNRRLLAARDPAGAATLAVTFASLLLPHRRSRGNRPVLTRTGGMAK